MSLNDNLTKLEEATKERSETLEISCSNYENECTLLEKTMNEFKEKFENE